MAVNGVLGTILMFKWKLALNLTDPSLHPHQVGSQPVSDTLDVTAVLLLTLPDKQLL